MNELENKILTVKNIVLRGFVKHSDIKPRLKNAGINENLADQVADISLNYRYKIPKSLFEKLFSKIPSLISQIVRIIFSVIAGLLLAEAQISGIIANSILKDKLKGLGDNILFWLGFKTVDVNMFDMMEIVINLFKNTFKILMLFFIGFFTVFLLWNLFFGFIKFIFARSRLNKNIKNLFSRYADTIDSQYEKIINK